MTDTHCGMSDDVLVKAMTEDFGDGEYERLLTTLADYQADLNRFAQGALGRYIGDWADGIVPRGNGDREQRRAPQLGPESQIAIAGWGTLVPS